MYRVSPKIKSSPFAPHHNVQCNCANSTTFSNNSKVSNIWYFSIYSLDNSSRRFLPLRLDAMRDYGIAARSFYLCQHSTISPLLQNPSDSPDSFGDSFSSSYTPDSCGLATLPLLVPLSTIREVELTILHLSNGCLKDSLQLPSMWIKLSAFLLRLLCLQFGRK